MVGRKQRSINEDYEEWKNEQGEQDFINGENKE
jgi:hypothetical protein